MAQDPEVFADEPPEAHFVAPSDRIEKRTPNLLRQTAPPNPFPPPPNPPPPNPNRPNPPPPPPRNRIQKAFLVVAVAIVVMLFLTFLAVIGVIDVPKPASQPSSPPSPSPSPPPSSTLSPTSTPSAAQEFPSSCGDNHNGKVIEWSDNATLPFLTFAENSAVSSLHFHPRENFLVAATGRTFNITVYRISKDDNIVTAMANLKEPRDANHVKVVKFSSMEGSMIASGSSNGKIHLWKWEVNDTHVQTLQHGEDIVTDIAFHPLDSAVFVSASTDGSIVAWKIDKDGNVMLRKRMGCAPSTDGSEIRSLSFRSDGKQLASADNAGRISAWNTVNLLDLLSNGSGGGECFDTGVTSVILGRPLYAVAYNCNSSLIASAGAAVASSSPIRVDYTDALTNGSVDLNDTNNLNDTVQLEFHQVRVRALAWYGPYLLSGSSSGHVVLWDSHHETPLQEIVLSGKDDGVSQVLSVDWSFDGNYIACGSFDGQGNFRTGRVRLYRVHWV